MELVPKKFWTNPSCELVASRFGIPPQKQVLDDNFHHEIIEKLPNKGKRGRPDIVHYALLDIMSTPAYLDGDIRPIIHTINKETINVGLSVRPPRTELRFNGVMSRILKSESSEPRLFERKGVEEIADLVESLRPDKVYCLSTQGTLRDLSQVVGSTKVEDQIIWIVGGFAHGHFSEETKSLADDIVSISDRSLPAHVVSARLAYEIERLSGILGH